MKYTHTHEFHYGKNSIVTAEEHPELMGSNFSVLKLKANQSYTVDVKEEHLALLLTGRVTFRWEDTAESAERTSIFHQKPSFFHADAATVFTIENTADGDSELVLVSTENAKRFSPRFFGPEDLLEVETVGTDILNGATKREKRVFYDRTNRVESNLFLGELINYPGCWACFPPHLHTEPEIYFYRFLPETGYGFSEYGDQAFKMRHNELIGIPEGLAHAQATAPGHAGYILWVQRLQEEGGNIVYRSVPEHAWTEDPEAIIYPERKE